MPVIIILIIIVVIMSIKCVKVIQQSTVGIIMRLGKFHKKADTGVHFLVPFIDTLSYRIDLKERVEDFPPQPVITKDNVTMQIDTVVYYQVTDPIRFVFEIANPNAAIENLTATTLRNIIGELDLDATLTSRDVINTKMRAILDEATDKWGIKVNRVELKNIMPPHDIQVMIEGPGHMPLNQIKANMEIQETICNGAPFYVLGPLVTDIAPGYDHITSAIGGAIAATYGASFLCYVTPAEHLRLPDVNDVKEGIIASKIAAHAADIAKGVPGARDWDEKMFDLAIDSEKARRYRAESKPENEDTCTMCGKMCAVRNINKILKGEDVDIME